MLNSRYLIIFISDSELQYYNNIKKSYWATPAKKSLAAPPLIVLFLACVKNRTTRDFVNIQVSRFFLHF